MNALDWAVNLQRTVSLAMGATGTLPVTRAHLVGSYHSGPANLRLLREIAHSGARVAIPTTLNSSAADLSCGDLRSCPGVADREQNREVVALLEEIGCQSTLTCAPYFLPDPPRRGECIAWAESNAVVYANSVLGARTNMTMQFLDLSAALIGTIPCSGRYLDRNRVPGCLVDVSALPVAWFGESAFYELLGSVLGARCRDTVPWIRGGPDSVHEDLLRSLGAAAATTGNLDIFHWEGVTPECRDREIRLQSRELPVLTIDKSAIRGALARVSRKSMGSPDTICLGAPHASRAELLRLAALLDGRMVRHPKRIVVSLGRHVHAQAQTAGTVLQLESLGVEFVRDTCTYYGHQLGDAGTAVMSPSFKWVYYASTNFHFPISFARLEHCVAALFSGTDLAEDPFWH